MKNYKMAVEELKIYSFCFFLKAAGSLSLLVLLSQIIRLKVCLTFSWLILFAQNSYFAALVLGGSSIASLELRFILYGAAPMLNKKH